MTGKGQQGGCGGVRGGRGAFGRTPSSLCVGSVSKGALFPIHCQSPPSYIHRDVGVLGKSSSTLSFRGWSLMQCGLAFPGLTLCEGTLLNVVEIQSIN